MGVVTTWRYWFMTLTMWIPVLLTEDIVHGFVDMYASSCGVAGEGVGGRGGGERCGRRRARSHGRLQTAIPCINHTRADSVSGLHCHQHIPNAGGTEQARQHLCGREAASLCRPHPKSSPDWITITLLPHGPLSFEAFRHSSRIRPFNPSGLLHHSIFSLLPLGRSLGSHTTKFRKNNTVKVINVSYASQHMGNCWFNFKYYNITYDDIHLSINDRTILNSDGYVPPVMNFSKPEGFKVEGCQTVSMRCHKDGVETIYKIQVKEEGGDGNGNWKIWVAVGFVSLFLVCLILGLFCYRKVRRRNKYHLPFCCESRMKDPIEDPAVEQNLCESQETLQSEQLTGCADPSSCQQ
ncbi:uncharacterized protein [Hemitrygon akajei]|uniref:uncharacterized protein isoform X1 n=1 Tax=Hemitrygon akajei TaxID=2704970 RepID=UPI003BF97C44